MCAISGIAARPIGEIEFWRDWREERPESEPIPNIANKMVEARVFLDCIERHREKLASDGRVVELGAGDGRAPCIYKRLFRRAHVTAADISEFAARSIPKWKRLLSVRLDGAHPCVSYQIKEPGNSIDRIFCFAAAYHFVAQKRTLHEISRAPKPGGRACYFCEPATPRHLYPLTYRRVNRKRPDVPEDVLITSKIKKIAEAVGVLAQIDYYPSTLCRGPIEGMYYYRLERFRLFHKCMPCTVNLIVTKPSL